MPIEKTSPSGLLSRPPERRPINPENFQRVSPGVYQNANGRTFAPKNGVMPPPRQIPPGVRTGGPLQAPQSQIPGMVDEARQYRDMMDASQAGYQAGTGYDSPGSGGQQWQQLPGQFQPGEQGPWAGMMPPGGMGQFVGGQQQQQGPWQDMMYRYGPEAGEAARYALGAGTSGAQGPREYQQWRQGRYPGQPIPSYVSGWSRQLKDPMGGMNPYAQEARRRAFNQRGIPQGRSPISEMKVVP